MLLALPVLTAALVAGPRAELPVHQQMRAAAAPLRVSTARMMADPAPPPVALDADMSEMELAEQAAKLDALSEKWRKRQAREEDEGAQLVGWSKAAEITNGRFAMFFLPVGLITEYYTGESVPQQVYTLLQTLGFVE
ncbi:hypothetical protein EMIHUDRAFT_450258 [Emiliania huxleyi CCMP1516]|uniref:Uncharacterized protein n=2 Tax=Emiliania huxleyi TaxID=2903 RepID=A0A0D3JS93_EMIH1|nr:hypothetical protein EMIHUDRAFT_450258 [Emiliania huxleyi CCMP1516]EOD26378.1 hypothetical protein EMIHUDRAFT_450258 [Emiliania huxleyi CCMP1516]|eukprot:XP_005778807.1 hypothetical protein EMIHUDRAFT_450258 [Emiliania huxleyi CCMP1516]